MGCKAVIKNIIKIHFLSLGIINSTEGVVHSILAIIKSILYKISQVYLCTKIDIYILKKKFTNSKFRYVLLEIWMFKIDLCNLLGLVILKST